MTSRETCTRLTLGEHPEVSVAALLDVAALLTAWHEARESARLRPAVDSSIEEGRSDGTAPPNSEAAGSGVGSTDRWEDLPSAVRERVRAELVALLHQAAGAGQSVEPADAE
jgi:hypothetical protein